MQMQKVNCQYGAPMGRASFGILENTEPRSVRLFKVRIDSGGYDDGGAYWGLGAPLYCATDGDDYRQFVRAADRNAAAVALELTDYPDRLRRNARP